MVGRRSAGWPGLGLIMWLTVALAVTSLSCRVQLAAQRWARAGWSWSKLAEMEPVLVRTKPKVLVPLMDHQVEGSVHQASRVGNLSTEAKAVAKWAVVPMRGVPGSNRNGAVAALVAELVHKDLSRVSDDKATVGRPRTI
jgi:hypothetical protein